MTAMLLSKGFMAQFGAELERVARAAGLQPEIIHLPDDPAQRLPADVTARIEVAYLTRDIRFSELYHSYGDAMKAATRLKWAHFVSTGIDQHPFLPALHERKVRLTTSAGSNGEPVGQTAFGGLLMLARGCSPKRDGDPVDEVHTLDKLPQLLPHCDWLVLACPYTRETHQLVNAKTLALMPRHAYLINVARGGCADEKALIAALQSKQIAGAYHDVFEKEPLPADSPPWDIPNVIVSPHNASASAGNDARAAKIFCDNIALYAAGKPLLNEQG